MCLEISIYTSGMAIENFLRTIKSVNNSNYTVRLSVFSSITILNFYAYYKIVFSATLLRDVI